MNKKFEFNKDYPEETQLEYNGKVLKVKRGDCVNCSFVLEPQTFCVNIPCESSERNDKEDVIFSEILTDN